MQIANEEQAKAWDGDEGQQWADNEERFNASSTRQLTALIDAADVGPSEHVIDIGCGCGATTREAARAAKDGEALGVDLSSAMLERATKRAEAEGVGNVRFEQADAQIHPFEAGAYDIAISKFGVMFFADPVAAFTNIRSAVRPGGRLAMIVWKAFGESDWVHLIREALAAGRDLPAPPPDAPSPFSLGDRERTTSILTAAGFSDVAFESVDQPLTFGSDTEDAFAFMTSSGMPYGLLQSIEDERLREEARGKLRAMLETHETPEGVLLRAPAWVVTAKR